MRLKSSMQPISTRRWPAVGIQSRRFGIENDLTHLCAVPLNTRPCMAAAARKISFDLRGGGSEIARRIDEEMCAAALLRIGNLLCQYRGEFRLRHALSRQDARFLHRFRSGRDHDSIDARLQRRFRKAVGCRARRSARDCGRRRGEKSLAVPLHQRMDDRLQPPKRCRDRQAPFAPAASRSTMPPRSFLEKPLRSAAPPRRDRAHGPHHPSHGRGTPAARKNSAIVDFPIPIEPVRPRISIATLAEACMRRKHDHDASTPCLRKAARTGRSGNPNMVEWSPSTSLEKMNAETFEPIGTDATEYASAGRIEITIDECRRRAGASSASRPPLHRRRDFPATHQAERGMEMMCPARQLGELSRSLHVRSDGLVKSRPSQSQNLIGAEDEIIGPELADRLLPSRAPDGGPPRRRRQPLSVKAASRSALSSISGAITRKSMPAERAIRDAPTSRCKNQGPRTRSKATCASFRLRDPSGLRDEFHAMFFIKIDDRRRSFLDRSAGHVDDRPACGQRDGATARLLRLPPPDRHKVFPDRR